MDGKFNRDMGKDCIDLIKRVMSHTLTPDQYYLELLELDRRHPLPSKREYSREDYRNYKKRMVVMQEGETKYQLHIQPDNHKQAAEMYRQNKQRMDEIFKHTPDRKTLSTGEVEDEISF